MGEPLVRFTNVSKRFLLEPTTDRSVAEILVRPFLRRKAREYFWPLRDVSFELEQGRSLGIIGENGTGKSTILKLVARILEPTGGIVEANGRISALLELGASFHPELTGRENVFLAASIAGINKAEISRHLEEVFAFADIGPFMDVSVKHYSSGMYVRLGFAVAAHLRPDILLIDEVLAVGDEAFQHKCLQAIHQMQQQGVSIVVVSHSLSQVASLCDTALWLHEGYVRAIGKPEAVIGDYLATSSAGEQVAQVAEWASLSETPVPDAPGEQQEVVQRYERGAPSPDARRWGDQAILIRDVRLLDRDARPAATLLTGEGVRIELDYEVQRPVEEFPSFGVAIYRSDELLCFGTNTYIEKPRLWPEQLPASGMVSIDMPSLQLLQGNYTLDAAIHSPDDRVTHDYVRAALRFGVQNSKGDQGVARQSLRWSLKTMEKVLR